MWFSLTRQQREDGVVTLAPVGEVDLRVVCALEAAIQDALCEPHCVEMVVDLARVTFLDCAGINALLAGRITAVSRGRGYTVANPQRQVRRILELSGVLTALTGRPHSAAVAGRTTRSRRSRRRDRVGRRAAAGRTQPE